MATAANAGLEGFGGDNGRATAVQLSTPSPPHHPSRRHQHPRYSGDGGTAVTATLSKPQEIPPSTLRGTCTSPQSATCPCAALPQWHHLHLRRYRGATSPPKRVVRRVLQTWPVRPVWCRTRQPLHRGVTEPGGGERPRAASSPRQPGWQTGTASPLIRPATDCLPILVCQVTCLPGPARRAHFARPGDRRHEPPPHSPRGPHGSGHHRHGFVCNLGDLPTVPLHLLAPGGATWFAMTAWLPAGPMR